MQTYIKIHEFYVSLLTQKMNTHRKMKLNKQLFALSFLFLTVFASAYDAIGHRIIADIAYQNLTEKTKTQVDKIVGKQGIVYTSTWADEVRSDKKYAYSYPWHYQNLRDEMTAVDFEKLLANPTSEGEHLFFAIAEMQTRLRKDKTDAEALKFLVHFVADLHQPMHLGRKEDLGGNKVDTKWFGKTTNLHSLWDTNIIESRKMSYTEYSRFLQDKLEPQKSAYKNYSLLQSVENTYNLRNEIYKYDYSNTNNYHYLYYFADKQDEALYRGGMQLAKILNETFK
jgi:hypothetical protein